MKNVIITSFLFIFSLFFIQDVSALENKFLGTYISSSGKFLSLNSYPSWTDQGYVITNGTGDTLAESAFAQPSSHFVLSTNGGAITQCEMSFLQGNYYSVTYYFGIESLNDYLHPYYSAWSNKFDVCTSSTCSPSHVLDSISSGIEYSYVGDVFQYIGTFTVIFQSPKNGTCVNIAFSANNSSNTANMAFLGYKYQDLGSKPLSPSDIENALSQNFTELENKIDAMRSEQEETNNKLDDIINADIPDSSKEDLDDSSYQDYQDAEDALIDSIGEADLSSVDIAIDNDSSNFIWDTITDIFQSHPLIMSTVIAILSIGIIKLALGR